jgi:hypothetical protein
MKIEMWRLNEKKEKHISRCLPNECESAASEEIRRILIFLERNLIKCVRACARGLITPAHQLPSLSIISICCLCRKTFASSLSLSLSRFSSARPSGGRKIRSESLVPKWGGSKGMRANTGASALREKPICAKSD